MQLVKVKYNHPYLATMSFDRWARFYDLIYSSYKDDVAFYTRLAKEHDGNILEIGCGTGRIYLEILKQEKDIEGIDISEAMLERCKSKAKLMGLKAKVYRQDMKSFSLKKSYSLVIIPFRAFLHNLTTKDQLSCLRCIRDHMAQDGLLVLNFFFPNPEIMSSDYGKNEETEIGSEDGRYLLSRVTRFNDETEQIIDVHETVSKGEEILMQERFPIALIYKKEFELLLKQIGFASYDVYGGFDKRPLSSYRQEMVWFVHR